jgi:hypothetical protein
MSIEQLIPSDLVYQHRAGETHSVVYSPEHRWHYVRQQRHEEVLFCKCYDSRADVARFAPHTASLEPNVPPGTPPDESIELRTLVFHRE